MAKCNEKVKQMFARLQKKLLVSALITASISSSMSLAVSAQVNTPQASVAQQVSIDSMTSFNEDTTIDEETTFSENNVSTSSIKAEAMDEYWDAEFNTKYDKILCILVDTDKGFKFNPSSLSSIRCHIIEKDKTGYILDSEALGKISIASRYVINIAAEQKKQEELEKKRQEEAAFDALDRSEGSSFWTHKLENEKFTTSNTFKMYFYDKYLSNVLKSSPVDTEDFFYRPICQFSEIKNRSDASKFNLNSLVDSYGGKVYDTDWYVEFSNGTFGILSQKQINENKRTDDYLLDRYTKTSVNMTSNKGSGSFVYCITQDSVVKVLKVEDGYCQVTYKGKTGWVKESDLQIGTPGYIYTKKYISRPGYVNIAAGTKLKILGYNEGDKEYRVQHPVFKWATFTLSASSLAFGAPYSQYTKNNIALYTSPAPSAKKATVVKGTKLSVLSTSGAYTKVKTSEGKVGYIASSYLSTTPVAKQLKKYYGNYYLVWPHGLNLDGKPSYAYRTGDSYYPRFTAVKRVDNWYYADYYGNGGRKSKKAPTIGNRTYNYIKVQGPDGRVGFISFDVAKRTLAQAKQAAKYYHQTDKEKQAFNYVNQLRAKAGLPKLKWNQQAYEEQNLVWSRYTERFGALTGTHSFDLFGDIDMDGQVIQQELGHSSTLRNATHYSEVMLNDYDNDNAKELVDRLCGKYDAEGNDNQHKAAIYDEHFNSACVTAIKQGNCVKFIIYLESNKEWGTGAKYEY